MKTKSQSIWFGILLLGASVATHAAQFGDFTYESSGTEISITGYTGPGGNVTIPDTITGLPVTSIQWRAFEGCTSLTRVTIGNSVTNIEWRAFGGCASLASIDVAVLNQTYSSLDGVLFNKPQDLLILYPPGRVGEYTIPISVTNIGNGAFYDCASLISVVIGNSVTSIGDHAFGGCGGLVGIYFDGHLPTFASGGDPFYGCPAVIVFYRAGTTGWGSTIAGHPTALWIEPPIYSEWLPSSGLPTQHPNASAEADDADQDGMSNYFEMLAGTDPTDRVSLLTLERVPRMNDLTAEDQTPIGAAQHAVYFRSVPGKEYGVQWAETVDGPWNATAVVIPTTTQKRLVFDKPVGQAFYRVILAQ